jgi:FKBP-type peptidyl-prolyl cis-trans isomerase FklB
MRKLLTSASTIFSTSATCSLIFACATLLSGNVMAQQAPAANSAQAPAASTQQTPRAKAPAASTTPVTPKKSPAAKAAPSSAAAPLALKTPKDKASYAIGLNIGRSMHKDSVQVDPNILARGLRDGMAGRKALLTDDEMKDALTTLSNDVRKFQEEKMRVAGETNKKAGETFLAANKAKAGVVTLPSGLQYKVVTPGAGPKPAATDSVVCDYRGTLLDGTEFDSSYKRGKPVTFPVTGVIKGWTEALQLMPVGSKWQLFIPSDLAYGPRGPSPEIGPNATLVFDVELHSIQPKPEPAAPAAPASAPATPAAPAAAAPPTPPPAPDSPK